MAANIQVLKVRAELARVTAARFEMEVKVQELSDALDRVNNEIEMQKAKEVELQLKLNEMSKEA